MTNADIVPDNLSNVPLYPLCILRYDRHAHRHQPTCHTLPLRPLTNRLTNHPITHALLIYESSIP